MVHTYALQFNMPIRPETTDLYFTWQDIRTLTNKPVSTIGHWLISMEV